MTKTILDQMQMLDQVITAAWGSAEQVFHLHQRVDIDDVTFALPATTLGWPLGSRQIILTGCHDVSRILRAVLRAIRACG